MDKREEKYDYININLCLYFIEVETLTVTHKYMICKFNSSTLQSMSIKTLHTIICTTTIRSFTRVVQRECDEEPNIGSQKVKPQSSRRPKTYT